MKLSTIRILNVLGFVLVIAMNTLANALPINGMNTGELSALYPNRFVPAGFTFSIWGLIYLALLGFVIYQFYERAAGLVRELGLWFLLSCLANSAWILAWHYQYVLGSLFIMLLLLGSLIVLYLRSRSFAGRGEWLGRLPFQLYLGWITVATVANATALLVHYGWQGGPLSETAWAAIMAAVAAGMGLLFLFRFRDIPYALVVLWALYGIYRQQAEGGVLEWTLIAAGLALVAALAYTGLKRSRT